MPEEIIGQNLPPSASVDSHDFNIDFGALKAKAAEMLDAAANTPEPAAVEPAAKAEPDKVEAAAPPADAGEPKVVDIPDDALVKVIVDGEEQLVPYKDAKAGFSRTQKFTKSMQQVAAERKAVEAERASIQAEKTKLAQLEQERAGIEAFLKNRAAIERFMQEQFGQPEQPVFTDPNELLTAEQAQRLVQQRTAALEHQLKAVQEEVQNRIEAVTGSIQSKQETAAHAVVIQSTLNDIFTANPVLKSIPYSEDLIRFQVSQLNPQTREEAVQAFKDVAQGMVEEIGQHYKASQKIQAVTAAKAKLESKSIEPAGGSAPQITPTNYKKADGSIDWSKLRSMAADML